MRVLPSELKEFLYISKQLPFKGCSVTMPLKEAILPYLDGIENEAREIGAVNTLIFQEGKWIGFNTDGIGALNAIERRKKVRDTSVVLLGAGGAAKAIAYEAVKRGAFVTILNRNADKADQIAEKLQCHSGKFDELERVYDILVNCTPSSLSIPQDAILSDAIIMDITTKPMVTEFLKCALSQGSQVIYGYEMFLEQALGQFQRWLQLPVQEMRSLLENAIVSTLATQEKKESIDEKRDA